MTTVLVACGPSRGALDRRMHGAGPAGLPEPSAPDLRAELQRLDPAITVDFRQTDDEASLVSWLHEATAERWAVVLDPAAFTHYSYALRDAAAGVTEAGLPLIEVHLTNPASRDDSRPASVITAVATGVITGLGVDSYRYAVQAAAARLTAATSVGSTSVGSTSVS